MLRNIIVLALTLACSMAASRGAAGETRLALVIGNSAYRHTTPLTNPARDAELISQALEQVGFKVAKFLDADKDVMLREMLAFGRSLRRADAVGLFYFAGHGVQINGLNYLVPVDAEINSEDEVRLQTVGLSEFLQTLNSFGEYDGRLNLIILDACRNNPFARGWRAVARGLAPVDSPSGTLVAFATAPGEVASDGRDGNSPYAKGLAQSILSPGLPVEETFKATRKYVKKYTDREKKVQEPWESTSLTGSFYFIPIAKQAAQDVVPSTITRENTLEADAARIVSPPNAPIEKWNTSEKNCISVGDVISKPLTVTKGTAICRDKTDHQAKIIEITEKYIRYSVDNGFSVQCSVIDVCGMAWPDETLLFKIRIVPDIAVQGVYTAEMFSPTTVTYRKK